MPKFTVGSSDSSDIDSEYKEEFRRIRDGGSIETEIFTASKRRNEKRRNKNPMVEERKRILKAQVGRPDLCRPGSDGNKKPKQCAICGWLGIQAHWSKHWRDHHPQYKVSRRL